MRYLLKFIIFSLFLNQAVLYSQWVQTSGPIGGSAYCSATSGSTIYIGTNSGVYYSTNDGNTWIQTSLHYQIGAIAICGSNLIVSPNQMGYAGIFLSTDNGETWTHVLSGLGFTALYVNGQNVYAACAVIPASVYLSTDGGWTWSYISQTTQAIIWQFAMRGPNILAACTGGIARSTDYGYTWTNVISLNYGFLAIKVYDSTFYAGSGNNILYKSTNNGLNWIQNVVPTGETESISAIAKLGSYIFVGFTTIFGVYYSTNDGLTWTQTTLNRVVDCLSILNNNLFAGTEQWGVYLSTNNGQIWSQTKLINNNVYSIAAKNSYLIAGLYWNNSPPVNIYFSTNDGDSWLNQANPSSLPTQCLLIKDTTIFASHLKSTDYGNNWSNMSGGGYKTLAANNSYIFGDQYTNGGILISSDNGTSWSLINVNNAVIRSIATNGTNIFAGSEYMGVFYSSNNGFNWTQTTLNTHYIFSIAINNSYVYAGTDSSGIFVSSNNGQNWMQTTLNNHTINALSILTLLGNSYIFAGTDSNGIYLSSNNGQSWTAINEGIGNVSVKALCYNNTYIFAGTAGYSVWRRPISDIVGIKNITGSVPNSFVLYQNYPNPFNPTTTINYELPINNYVKLIIYDILGREIKILVNEKQNAGRYEVTFDGNNLASGIYFYKLIAGDFVKSNRMVLLK